MKFLKQATYICNSKAFKISPNQHADLFYSGFRNGKGPRTRFQATFFFFFDKKFFAILHKLAKFCDQAVLISQVIHKYVFRFSCLGI